MTSGRRVPGKGDVVPKNKNLLHLSKKQSEMKGQPALADHNNSTVVKAPIILMLRRKRIFSIHRVGATQSLLRHGTALLTPSSSKSKPELRGMFHFTT